MGCHATEAYIIDFEFSLLLFPKRAIPDFSDHCTSGREAFAAEIAGPENISSDSQG